MASDKGKGLICPIYEKSIIGVMSAVTRQRLEIEKSKCIENKCAWWDSNSERCSIKVIAQNLYKETA